MPDKGAAKSIESPSIVSTNFTLAYLIGDQRILDRAWNGKDLFTLIRSQFSSNHDTTFNAGLNYKSTQTQTTNNSISSWKIISNQ